MGMEMNGLTHPLIWWLANDIVLAQGQQGVISDLGYFKIGDGNNPFSALPVQGVAPVSVWFSEFGILNNTSNTLDTIYDEWLIGGSMVQQGNWIDFCFDVVSAANSNTKNVFVKFSNQLLLNYSVPTGAQTLKLVGKIKVLDYTLKKAFYSVTCGSSIVSGQLTGINWNVNNSLLLQFQGTANNDLIANGGEGKINIIPRF
jgi:hypothetical protein